MTTTKFKRYLCQQVDSDLEKKMVFVGGPRQVGKTTMAKQLLKKAGGVCLNWDTPADRDRILQGSLPDAQFWCFDEIHKYDRWRNFLKGLYDAFIDEKKILVTGSARLDYYRYGGDSLQGRYHYLRLHPLTVAELGIITRTDLTALLKLGGFPEPFFSGSERQAKRWTLEYRTRLVQEDIRSLETIKNLGSIELLSTRLPNLVGSPLSINALREDLQVSHQSVSLWLDILERVYHIFRLIPFGHPRIKAIKKESKHYHFDWSLVKDPGARFENFVASHLLKWVHYCQDAYGDEIELRYFREISQREVDFVIIQDAKPKMFIECKLAKSDLSKNLTFLKNKFPEVDAVQIVLDPEISMNGGFQ